MTIFEFFTAKERLANYSPNASVILQPKNRSVLQQWLAARYQRTGFPEEFERRLRGASLDRRIAKIIEPHGEHLVAILFDVDEGELVERRANDPYILSIYVLYYTGEDPGAAEKSATRAATAIFEEFRKRCFDPKGAWEGIELVSCEAVSDMAMPYARAMQLARLNLEYLSHRANE